MEASTPPEPLARPPTQDESQRLSEIEHILKMPGIDMTALKGVSTEQILAIANLFKTGAISLPADKPNSYATDRTTTTNGATPAPARLDDSDDADPDGEDGEILPTSKQRDFLRPPPTGPRNRSRSPRSVFASGDRLRPHGPQLHPQPVTVTSSFPPLATDNPDNTSPHSPAQLSHSGNAHKSSNPPGSTTFGDASKTSKFETSRAFLQELHKAGFTFDQLAKEVTNEQLLRDMYARLGISDGSHNDRPAIGTNDEVRRSAPDDSHIHVKPKKLPVAKPARSQDRGTYLAKLQAAKNKKAESVKSDAVEKKAIPAKAVDAVTTDTKVITSPPPTSKATAKNEMIRARLEALKAKQAAKNIKSQDTPQINMGDVASDSRIEFQEPTKLAKSLASRNTTFSAESGAITSDTGHAPDCTLATPASASTVAKLRSPVTSPSLNQSPYFTGLPGLFMTTSLSGNSVPAAPALSPSKPAFQSYPTDPFTLHASSTVDDLPSSHIESPANRAVPSYPTASSTEGLLMRTRSFGHPRVDMDESIIITNSDDEGDDDTDDFYGLNPTPLDRVRNMTPHSSGHTPSLSSNPSTPLVVQHSSDLKRKLQEIEEAKRALAEAQKRKKVPRLDSKPILNMAGPDVPATMEIATTSALMDQILAEGEIQQVEQSSAVPRHPIIESLTGVKSDAIAKEKERLRRRLEELQKSRLAISSPSVMPSIPDAEQHPPRSKSFESFPRRVQETNLFSDPLEHVGHPDQNADGSSPPRRSEENPAVSFPQDTLKSADSTSASSSPASSQSSLHPKDDVSVIHDPGVSDEHDFNRLSDVESTKRLVPQDEDEEESSQDDVAMDVSDSSSDSSEFEPMAETVPADLPTLHTTSFQQTRPVADGTSSDDILGGIDVTSRATQEQPPSEEISQDLTDTVRTTHYRPYESPLARFKDFRYHTQFADTVPGGHKSLTYSHNIDAENTLCPYEAAGGICNDKSCTHQHFKTMAVSDNDLLRMMGTENMPVRTPDEEKVWKDGLGAVIKQLRSTNVGKDVSAIAQRIAEYRREFVADPSKVLRLD